MADPVERDREAGLARPAWVAVVVLLLVTVAALGGGVAMGRSSATSSDLPLDLGLPLLTWPGHSFVDTLVVHRDQRDLDTQVLDLDGGAGQRGPLVLRVQQPEPAGVAATRARLEAAGPSWTRMFAPSRNTVVYISPIGDYAGHAQREARWIEAGRAPAVLEVYDLRTPADIMDVVEQLTPATPDTFARQVVEAPMPPKTGNPTVHFLLPTDADLRVYEPRRGLTVNGIGPDHGYRLTTVSSNGADAERTATPGGSAVRGHPVVDDGDRGLGWVEGGAYVSLTGGPDARALAESLTTATDAQWERWIFGVSDP